jgi:NAD+ synthase
MELIKYLIEIEKFLIHKLEEAKLDGYVLGLSGGVDSSLVAAIASRAVNKKLFALIMPCHSDKQDEQDALLVAKTFDIDYAIIDLSSTYDHLLAKLEKEANKIGTPIDDIARINLKVRLRMISLYAFAQARRSLVLGTDNWAEYHTGYFTKYGDGAVDVLPIVYLTKQEVMQAAKMMNVPQTIVQRKPSAGLYIGQTDEQEMGVTYEQIDAYLLGKEIDKKAKLIIENLHRISSHKRDPLPTPPFYNRD